MSLLAMALAASLLSLPPIAAAQPPQAPDSPLPGRYIVVLKEGAGPAAVAKDHGVAPDFVYKSALSGFAGPASAKQAKALGSDPRVASVEPDRAVHALAQTLPTGVDRIDADVNPTAAIAEGGGNVPVTVAVIDTGIDLDHPDLNVAAGLGMTCASGKKTPDDQNGHGSHVAGSVAALDNGIGVVGVAPGAAVVPVRVLSPTGSGSLSCVIAGIDHVTANAKQIAVANMSLGWQGNSSGAREAIKGSVAAGVVYTVAAGNEGDDVYGPDGAFGSGDEYEPASYPEVAAISALADSDGSPGGSGANTSYGPDDSFATFSNHSAAVVASNPVESPGKAIDLLLPGVAILSTYKDGGYATASGTSMASPHAAGLAALYVADNGRATDALGVAAIRQALIDAGRDQASGLRLAHPLTEPDLNPENLGWAGSANTAPAANPTAATTGEDTSVVITLSGSDPETCELTFSIVSGPSNGSLGTVNSQACAPGPPNTDTAALTYTPTPNFNGADSFVFRVIDGDGATDTATVSLTVTPLADPPTAAAVSLSTSEDAAAAAWTPQVADPDAGAVLTCSIPAGGGPSNGNASVASDCLSGSYAPDPNFNGSDSFTYEVSDGSLSDTATVTVTVSAVNDAPSADPVSVGTAEDSAVTVTLSGSDVETCELGFSIVGGPANGNLGEIAAQACTGGEPNTDTATVTYTPNPDFNGSDSFTYEVLDGAAASSEAATVTVTVNPVNDAPVANDDSASTDVGTAVSLNVLSNDSDVDGDGLAIYRYDSSSVKGGSVSCNLETGACTYTPPSGFSGEDTFAYEATDGTQASNTATVTIGVSSPPTAAPAAPSTAEDSAVEVTLSGSDPETCELGFSIISGPAHGSLSTIAGKVCASGTPNTDTAALTYTPTPNFNGADSFVFRVIDGDGATDTATVSLTVTPLADPPTAAAVSLSTSEDAAAAAWTPQVADPDADAVLSCSIPTAGAPSDGEASVALDCSSGGGAYTPNPNFNGSDSFTYEVSDGTATATATVTVTVGAVNDAPSAEAVSVGTAEDNAVTVTLSGSDVESCELGFSIVGGPASGSLGAVADQTCGAGDTATVTYTPNANFNGSDSFTYEVSDGTATDTATVTVTVSAVNDAPVAVGDSYSTQEGEMLSVAAPGVLGNDSDVDVDVLAAVLAAGPSSGTLTLNADGSLTYTPKAGFSGEDSFTYEASDGTLGSAAATVTIVVEAAAVGGFLEDFEGGATGWTASGLWHLANSTSCTSPANGYTSATHSFYFGNESSCSYKDRRQQVAGALTSPTISGLTSGTGTATLSFSSWRQVESYAGGAFDRTWVEVSYNGGSSWAMVWSRDSTNPSLAAWTAESVTLSPSGETAIVRFRFDTIDGVGNDYRGWLVDDVTVQ